MRQPLAVAVGRGIARLDGRAHAHDDGLGRLEVVGVPLQADERLNARVQLRGVERLDEEVVAPGLDASQPIAAIRLRCQDHDRDEARGGWFFSLPTEVEALTARRDEIDEHDVGGVCSHAASAASTVTTTETR